MTNIKILARVKPIFKNNSKSCLDVEENENGSKRILRGGHDFSDRLEEGQNLTIPHGFAVSIGIIMQLKKDKK